jgi:hypothetical protein
MPELEATAPPIPFWFYRVVAGAAEPMGSASPTAGLQQHGEGSVATVFKPSYGPPPQLGCIRALTNHDDEVTPLDLTEFDGVVQSHGDTSRAGVTVFLHDVWHFSTGTRRGRDSAGHLSSQIFKCERRSL